MSEFLSQVKDYDKLAVHQVGEIQQQRRIENSQLDEISLLLSRRRSNSVRSSHSSMSSKRSHRRYSMVDSIVSHSVSSVASGQHTPYLQNCSSRQGSVQPAIKGDGFSVSFQDLHPGSASNKGRPLVIHKRGLSEAQAAAQAKLAKKSSLKIPKQHDQLLATQERQKRQDQLEKLQNGKHIKTLMELPSFPIDMVQMKIRNRKLLASLNQKKRFKDFEYKNYDSTDSDIYEDEDYLKITPAQIDKETDFLRKRRLQRRLKVKQDIQLAQKMEREAMLKRGKRGHHATQSQPAKQQIRRTALQGTCQEDASDIVIKNKKELNEVFAECIIPKMNRIRGKPKPKIDSGLDSHMHNYYTAEERRLHREKELSRRMQNPLTFPTKNETLRDQKRAIPTTQTMIKMGIMHKKRYMGNIQLENLIMDNLSKYGLLVNGNNTKTENPALLREAMRPSLITQHINFQSKKIWKRDRLEKKQKKIKLRNENNLLLPPNAQEANTDSIDSSSFESLDIDMDMKSMISDESHSGKSSESAHKERRKQKRHIKREAKKHRSMYAREKLRQMNDIGIENVKGFAPTMLMKLTPKAAKDELNKKREEERKQKKLEDQMLKYPTRYHDSGSAQSDESRSNMSVGHSSKIGGNQRTPMQKSPDSQQKSRNARFKINNTEQMKQNPKQRMKIGVMSLGATTNDDDIQMDELESLKEASTWRFTSPKATKQPKLGNSEQIRKNLLYNKLKYDQQRGKSQNMHNRSVIQSNNLNSFRSNNSRVGHPQYSVEQMANPSMSLHANRQIWSKQRSPQTATHMRARSFNQHGRTFDFSMSQGATTPNVVQRISKAQQKLQNIHREIRNFQQADTVNDYSNLQSLTTEVETAEQQCMTKPSIFQQSTEFKSSVGDEVVNPFVKQSNHEKRQKMMGSAMPSPRNSNQLRLSTQMNPARLATAGKDPSFDVTHSLTISKHDSYENERSILKNWNEFGMEDIKFVRELYNEAIQQVLDDLGGFPCVDLRKLPSHRTSKQHILKQVPKENEMQMIPKLPKHMRSEQTGEDFDSTKISAAYLDAKKQKRIFQLINQTLNGLADDDHKKKYYDYLVTQGITIVSDIFERMDMDRKIVESLRKLQSMDKMNEEEFYAKKQALMRKMTQKATKFLYEKEPKKQGTSLREMAAKKAHEEKMEKARSMHSSNDLSAVQASVSRRTSRMSVVSRKSTNMLSRSQNYSPNDDNSRQATPDRSYSRANSHYSSKRHSTYSSVSGKTKSDIDASESEELDELKELELRTGLVQVKVDKNRRPVIKKPSNLGMKLVSKKLTTKTLTFADTVNGLKTGKPTMSIPSHGMSGFSEH